jgi:hypothetical protein
MATPCWLIPVVICFWQPIQFTEARNLSFEGPKINFDFGTKTTAPRYYFKLKAIKCEGAAGWVNTSCRFKPARNKFGEFWLNITILKEVRQLKVSYTK